MSTNFRGGTAHPDAGGDATLRPAGLAGLAYELGLLEIDRAELDARYALPGSNWIAFRGGRLHYVDECETEAPLHTVVMIHGFSASVHTWNGVAAIMRKTCRVIRIDLPPFGLSGPLPEVNRKPQRVDLAVLREAVDTLMDTLSLPPAILIGNSLGGLMAWDCASRRPACVAQLVLISAAGFPMRMPAAIRLLDNPVARWLAPHLQPAAGIRAAIRDCYGDPTRVTPATHRRYTDLTFARGTRAAIVNMVPGLDLAAIDTAPLARLEIPTLVLWGARDRWIPPAHGRRFAETIPGARLVSFPTLGHVPMEEDPTSVASEILSFIEAPRA